MSNYSNNESSVRVDIFKPSGKWYQSIAVSGADYTGCVHNSVRKATKEHLGTGFKGMTAVCIHPYHEHSHPVMFIL